MHCSSGCPVGRASGPVDFKKKIPVPNKYNGMQSIESRR